MPGLNASQFRPTSDPILADAGCTDVGRVRAANEDAFVRRPDARLWAVADGMGGHEDGEWASAAIAARLGEVRTAGALDADGRRVADAIQDANSAIYARAQARGLRMGSTVVALMMDANRYGVLWAGDSRAYRLRAGRLVRLTTDHTQVQARLDRGLMTAEEARGHPMAHVLTRAVGVGPKLELDGAAGPLQAGDVFLLSSDGLHGLVADDEIAEAMGPADPDRACEALLALANARGGPDNITVVAVVWRP